MPPSRAIAIASLLSVTVSIAALINGIFKSIPLQSVVRKSTVAGKTAEAAGISSTSSNVKASFTILFISNLLLFSFEVYFLKI